MRKHITCITSASINDLDRHAARRYDRNLDAIASQLGNAQRGPSDPQRLANGEALADRYKISSRSVGARM